MRAVIQRVNRASVAIDGEVYGAIGKGLMVLLGIHEKDTEADLQYMVDKISGLRIFEDEQGKINLALSDVGGEILLVSQFTLYGDARKGRRPGFIEAARPETAIPLYQKCIFLLRKLHISVATGKFGADMQVELVNDGPVTILLDSTKAF